MPDKEVTMAEADWKRSMARLEAMQKGSGGDTGTQIVQGRQGKVEHAGHKEETYDDYDKTNWDDEMDKDGVNYQPKKKQSKRLGKGLTDEELYVLKSLLHKAKTADQDEEEGDQEFTEDEMFAAGRAKVSKKAAKARKALNPDEEEEEDEDEDEGEEEEKEEGEEDEKKALQPPAQAPPRPGGGMAFGVKKGHKGPCGKACKCAKSFEDFVDENETLRKGVLVTPFLTEFTRAFGLAMKSLETNLSSALEAVYQDQHEYNVEQGKFNKSLSDTIEAFAGSLQEQSERISEVEGQPVGPPRSQLRAVEKSFTGQDGPQVDKQVILDALLKRIQNGESALGMSAIKYETTGEIDPRLYTELVRSINANN